MAALLDFLPTFTYAFHAQEIIFAHGSLAQLSDAIERYGWQRLMLCTSHPHGQRVMARPAQPEADCDRSIKSAPFKTRPG
jgi:hypothetical protein